MQSHRKFYLVLALLGAASGTALVLDAGQADTEAGNAGARSYSLAQQSSPPVPLPPFAEVPVASKSFADMLRGAHP